LHRCAHPDCLETLNNEGDDMVVMYKPIEHKKLAEEVFAPKLDIAEVREKIVLALNNPSYRSRTLQGISQETKLQPTVVLQAITNDRILAHAVKIVPMRSKDGRLLITTKNRFSKEASFKEKFVDFFASRRQEVVDAK